MIMIWWIVEILHSADRRHPSRGAEVQCHLSDEAKKENDGANEAEKNKTFLTDLTASSLLDATHNCVDATNSCSMPFKRLRPSSTTRLRQMIGVGSAYT